MLDLSEEEIEFMQVQSWNLQRKNPQETSSASVNSL